MFNRQNRELSRKLLEIRGKFPLEKDFQVLRDIGEEISKRENLDHELIEKFLNIVCESARKINLYEIKRARLALAIDSLYYCVSRFNKKFEKEKDFLGLNESALDSVNNAMQSLRQISEILESSLRQDFYNEIKKEKHAFLKRVFKKYLRFSF